MGEISDAIVGGFYCQRCGGMIDGEEPGYPRNCADCGGHKGGCRPGRSAKRRANRKRRKEEERCQLQQEEEMMEQKLAIAREFMRGMTED